METKVAKVKNKLKLLDVPSYGYWSALYRSFYSRRLYVDIGKRWSGYGLCYLLLMMALWSIPFAVKMINGFGVIFEQQLIDPLKKIPTLYIQNGQVSFDKPMPYLVKDSSGQVVVIVDTTDKINNLSDKYPHLAILINKDKITIKMPTPQIPGMIQNTKQAVPLIQHFNPEENAIFNGKKIVEDGTFSKWKYFIQAMIYPVAWIIFFAMFLALFLIFTTFGQLFSRVFFSFPITFKQTARLMIVAATPMMLVLLFLLLFNLTFPGYGYALMPILVLYFAFAVYALSSESNQVARL